MQKWQWIGLIDLMKKYFFIRFLCYNEKNRVIGRNYAVCKSVTEKRRHNLYKALYIRYCIQDRREKERMSRGMGDPGGPRGGMGGPMHRPPRHGGMGHGRPTPPPPPRHYGRRGSCFSYIATLIILIVIVAVVLMNQ